MKETQYLLLLSFPCQQFKWGIGQTDHPLDSRSIRYDMTTMIKGNTYTCTIKFSQNTVVFRPNVKIIFFCQGF